MPGLTRLLEQIHDPAAPARIRMPTLAPGEIEAIRRELEKDGFLVCGSFDTTGSDATSVMDLLDRSFSFPDYFGRNWDAVGECLADLSWLHGRYKGYCFVLGCARAFAAREPRDYSIFLDCRRTAAEKWQERERAAFKFLEVGLIS